MANGGKEDRLCPRARLRRLLCVHQFGNIGVGLHDASSRHRLAPDLEDHSVGATSHVGRRKLAFPSQKIGADVFWKEFPVATEFAYLPLQLEDMFCMCGEGKGL